MNTNTSPKSIALMVIALFFVIIISGCKSNNTLVPPFASSPEITEFAIDQTVEPQTQEALLQQIPISFSINKYEENNDGGGWIWFNFCVAAKNISSENILIHTVSDVQWEINPSGLILDISESYVETEEGKTYPQMYSDIKGEADDFPIPLNLSVLYTYKVGYSLEESPDNLAFRLNTKIPELLHPTRFVLSPGIVYPNGQTQLLYIDLTSLSNLPQSPTLNDIDVQYLPETIQISDFMTATIPTNTRTAYIDNYSNGYGSWPVYYVALYINYLNSDITSDQPLSNELYIIDSQGDLYVGRNRYLSQEKWSDDLPSVVGPNQTITAITFFPMSEKAAYGNQKFYVIDNNFNAYILDFTTQTPIPDLTSTNSD